MRKILTILLLLLALAVPMWAGEKTITISRNEGTYEVSNGVYTITKDGVQLVMTGGMNNPNYLLMMQQTTMTFLSNNYKIKKIIFHCLDNTVESNLDCFFWGPTTLSVQKNLTHNETPGTYTAPYSGNSYDGCWVSSPTYNDGLPTSYELMFANKGKPVRFASIDVVVDKDMGDIFDLVTSNSEIQENQTYVLVSQYDSRALSNGSLVNGPEPAGGNAYITQTFASTPVTFPVADKSKVKTTDDVQLITLGTSDSNNYPWVLKVGENYIRRRSGADHKSTSAEGNRGWNLYKEGYDTGHPEYFRFSISIGTAYNSLIRSYVASGEESNLTDYNYAIRHHNGNNYFRFINYNSSTNQYSEQQRVFLYKPAENYRVLTGCNPAENNPGYITLGDGVLEINGVDYSQSAETVTFFVGNQNGYQIQSINVYTATLDDNGNITGTTLYEGLTATSTTSTGANYSFTMPASHVYIEANFVLPTYYDITTICTPAEGGAITMTGGVTEYNNVIEATEGSTVSFTVDTNDGYTFNNVTIIDSKGNPVDYNYDESTGTYSFTMPDAPVTVTANFKTKLIITTACVTSDDGDGGYFNPDGGYMFCNGEETNFYNGAQYYEGDAISFKVFAKDNYRINSVTVTDANNNVTTLTATSNDGENKWYSFNMPSTDVTITAYFGPKVSDLYLLGTHNGNQWVSYGPKFDYDADNQQYYITVYYKGTGVYGDTDGYAFGEFSMTKSIDETGNWGINNADRLLPNDYRTDITEESGHLSLYNGNERATTNAFKIPAGIYTIYVNKNMTETWVEKDTPTLTFDPAGGTAEEPETVSKGALVTLNGDLYNKIKAINPDEADGNFMYKATPSIDGTAQAIQTESAGASTTQIATLDVVNEGETVTKLDGVNYLGWIVANNTGYYKVIDTPLHWIEENGKKDNTYTVSDKLQGVYAQGTSLWCKDLGNISIVKTTPNTGQVDFLMNDDHCKRVGGWDQSNWVELDFSGFDDGETRAQAGVEHYIEAGSITGEYTDDVNYKIKVKSNLSLTEAPEYVPNHYCTANFIEGNLKIGENVGPTVGNTTYYFLNPKIQEYAIITYAMWDKPNQIMVIPNNNPFSGAARIGMWDLNKYGNQLDNLDAAALATPNNQYEFHIIVQRNDKTYGSPATRAIKPNQAASTVIKIQPIDLQASSPMTAINTVGTEAQVVGVEYVNIAGVRSSKPFAGMNIVVTRYSDGTFSTTKVVK